MAHEMRSRLTAKAHPEIINSPLGRPRMCACVPARMHLSRSMRPFMQIWSYFDLVPHSIFPPFFRRTPTHLIRRFLPSVNITLTSGQMNFEPTGTLTQENVWFEALFYKYRMTRFKKNLHIFISLWHAGQIYIRCYFSRFLAPGLSSKQRNNFI